MIKKYKKGSFLQEVKPNIQKLKDIFLHLIFFPDKNYTNPF